MSVTTVDQLPRAAVLWVMLAQFALLLPHLQQVPWWLAAVYIAAALWRLAIFRGVTGIPSRWIKLPLAVFAFSGIYASYGTLMGLEPTVALLLAAFALKLLESTGQKDGYLLVFLGYFVCVTVLLFSQALPVVVYLLAPVVLLTTALLSLHLPGQSHLQFAPLGKALLMLGQSVPLMLVLFFLFPRIGPLWQVPLKQSNGISGVSDRMKPGDISRLSQSQEVAFRVQFEQGIPPRDQLYWRGPVLSRFVDGSWHTLRERDIPFAERVGKPFKTEGTSYKYSIILEPTGQHWLFALRRPQASSAGIRRLPDDQLLLAYPVQDRYAYRMVSWPEVVLSPVLSSWRRTLETHLPARENPQTQVLANALWAKSGNAVSYIDAVLNYFRREPFYYTLEPPLLNDLNPVDHFLFGTRRGFCEHYAYAFVVMMRTVGLPARVVTGYQGGEINPLNRSVIVRQFDAHAWAEVWIDGKGWQRVDPTAAVSPQRIEMGLQLAAADEFLSDSPLSPLHFTRIAWLNSLRLQYDALVYRWQKFVLNYDAAGQTDFLYNVLGEINRSRMLLLFAASALLVLVPVAWLLLRPHPSTRLSPENKALLSLQKKLAPYQLQREPSEPVSHWCERAGQVFPDEAARLRLIAALYEQLNYAPADNVPADTLQQLKRAIARLRLHLQQK